MAPETLSVDDVDGSLTDLAYSKAHAMILDGRLPIGQAVSVASLAIEFGMSRSPVRSAMERLLAERLVRRTPSGVAVAELGRHDLLDALAVRGPLEGLAARLAAPHIEEETLARLSDIHERFRASVESGDQAASRRLDLDFHRAIQRLSENACLIDSLERVQTQVILAAYSTAWSSSRRQALLEHTRILAALAEQDGDAAEEAAIRHLRNLSTRVLDEWKRAEARRN